MTSTTKTPDRFEKKVLLRAPIARVWRAISDSKEFGSWFGIDFDGPFVPGTDLKGRIVPTKADAAIAAAQEPYRGKPAELAIEEMIPNRRLSFRWHPYAVDPAVDYSREPRTRVVFSLEEAAGGTELTITESGFDGIPLERRAKAFTMNEDGWAGQATLLGKYLEAHAG